MFFLCFFFVTFLSHYWDTIIGSISSEFVFISVLTIVSLSQVLSKLNRLFILFSHHWDNILGFVSIYVLFHWFHILFQSILFLFSFASLGCHPKVYVGLIIYSLHFSSIELNPRLNLSLIFDPMVCHQQDTILGKPSYVLYQFILCSFAFSSLGHHPRFFLSLFFVHLVSYHPRFYYGDAVVLGSIQVSLSSFSFSLSVHHPRFYLGFFLSSFGFSTLRHYPRFYQTLIVCSFGL